jgi:uncharacterized protein HemX
MARKKETREPSLNTIVMDGNLETAEALAALSAAALAATAALPAALGRCETQRQMEKVIADRDICQLAYSNSLQKSLRHTGPLFEQIAKELNSASEEIDRKSKELAGAAEAVDLLAAAARLAGSLALAFG